MSRHSNRSDGAAINLPDTVASSPFACCLGNPWYPYLRLRVLIPPTRIPTIFVSTGSSLFRYKRSPVLLRAGDAAYFEAFARSTYVPSPRRQPPPRSFLSHYFLTMEKQRSQRFKADVSPRSLLALVNS